VINFRLRGESARNGGSGGLGDNARVPDEPASAEPVPAKVGPADRSAVARGSAAADGVPRGADLAREALAAARAGNAARRKAAGRAPRVSGGSATRLRRRRWSGAGPDAARDPQLLGATMRTWVKAAGVGADLTRATLFGRWEQIVGSEVAGRCTPTALVDRELVVQAESTAWATQIRLLAPQLLAKINAELGDRSVVRIRARGPAGPSWRFGTRHVSGRGPRDTYG